MACHDPRPFEEFIRYHPRPKPATQRRAAPRGRCSATVVDLLLQECPFLDKEDFEGPKPVAKRAMSNRNVPHEHLDQSENSGIDEDDDAAHPDGDDEEDDAAHPDGDAGIELAGVRADLAVAGDHTDAYFRVTVEATVTRDHTGQVTDCARGQATNGNVKRWCDDYAFPKGKSFAFNLYEREGAMKLAREFCRRGNYFAALHAESMGDHFELSDHDVAACGDGGEFVAWFVSLDHEDPGYRKGLEVKEIAPRTQ